MTGNIQVRQQRGITAVFLMLLGIIISGLGFVPSIAASSVSQEAATNAEQASPVGSAPVAEVDQAQIDREGTAARQVLTATGIKAFGDNVLPRQFSSFDLGTPNMLNNFIPADGNYYAGDFGPDGIMYAIEHFSNDFVAITKAGGRTVLGTSGLPTSRTWTGMAYDPSTGIMYASSTANSCNGPSTLYTVDLENGAVTVVGDITNSPCNIALASDHNGKLYGHDIETDELLEIDAATGAGTVIGPIGFDARYAQGFTYDPNSGQFYMAAYNTGAFPRAQLRTVDIATGATTLVGDLGTGGAEITWLAIERDRCSMDNPDMNIIEGTDRRDRITGTDGDDLILGYGDDDTIDGKGGNDCIIGGPGRDRLIGGEGNDILWGGDLNDENVYDRRDRDRLYGEEGHDLLYGGGDHDHLEGDEGSDGLYGDDGNDGLHGDDGNDVMLGGDGKDRMEGRDGDDQMWGDAGDDTIVGRDGDDYLNGGDDKDRLEGGEGNDMMHGGNGDDRMNGDKGNDFMWGEGGKDSMQGRDGIDTMYGGNEDDHMNGGRDHDRMFGGYGNDRMDGDRDYDWMYGNDGDDILDGRDGDDLLFGGSGDDELKGGKGDDHLDGGVHVEGDRLDGHRGEDTCVNGESLKACEIVP